jgi:8-oxo-dGTP pyrophosphatase MutT (NUDIX family)
MVRLAATVMLVRPAAEPGFEVLLLRRSQASHFVPDAYVFPGGTVDVNDATDRSLARMRATGEEELARLFRAQSSPQLPAPFGMPEPGERAALMVAALRELYEEAGVVLACDAAGAAVSMRDYPLADRSVPFVQLLEDMDAYGNAAALALFSHWITPPVYPKRYNTYFFLALASREQAASADAVETHDGIWVAPRTALERCERGELRLVYPTIKHLERLAEFDDAYALLDFARTKPVYSIMPNVSGESEFALPRELERAW